MTPCITYTNSLVNPNIFTTQLHISTCILVPVHIFGAYCILLKTPKKMESVKWILLNLHCFSTLLDLAFSFITMPYAFFPAAAGYALGIFDAPFFEVYLMVSMLGGIGVAITITFENRYFVLFGRNTWWEQGRYVFLVFSYLLIALFFLPAMLMVPDQATALEEISKMLPCTPELFLSGRKLFLVTTDLTTFVAPAFGMTFWNICQALSFAFIIAYKMIKQAKASSITSSKTLEMQRKLMITLGLQFSFAFMILGVPICYVTFSMVSGYYNQLLNNLVICMFSSHGVFSTIVMIIVHHPYREFTVLLVSRLICKTKATSVTGSRVSVVPLVL